MSLFTVGQILPTGATVVADDVQTNADGSTVERMEDSAGNTQVITTPGVGTAQANAVTLNQRALTALTNNQAFLSATKPSTASAQASAAYDQTVKLTRQVNAIIRLLVVQDTSTITDS